MDLLLRRWGTLKQREERCFMRIYICSWGLALCIGFWANHSEASIRSFEPSRAPKIADGDVLGEGSVQLSEEQLSQVLRGELDIEKDVLAKMPLVAEEEEALLAW